MAIIMSPLSWLLGGWSKIMHIKNLGITWHVVIPHKCQQLLCLNSWSYCCWYIVTLHCHYLMNCLTIKMDKIACQSAEKQLGDEEGPSSSCMFWLYVLCVRACPVKGWEWRICNVYSNVEILCGCRLLVQRYTSPLRRSSIVLQKEGVQGLWCSFLCRRHWSRAFPHPGHASVGTKGQRHP